MFLAETAAKAAEQFQLFGMSNRFWIIMIVLALFVVSILTSSYNEDKTKGL
ncbi:hypothetical protein [Cohnella abietis]|uniref:Uncharacterized protein n=1 Tax=Cohnella abietis TaxID=2507935 RepID=A0A3T1D2D2_9BACL|nr:hypothetical protein [Cohnella abietis]BBI32244.1 hypothetical protein KCTCHS21_16430 [Cohnella abietis]